MTLIPRFGIEKSEHDAIVAAKQRPLTQGPMRVPLREDDVTAEPSLIDAYMKGEG